MGAVSCHFQQKHYLPLCLWPWHSPVTGREHINPVAIGAELAPCIPVGCHWPASHQYLEICKVRLLCQKMALKYFLSRELKAITFLCAKSWECGSWVRKPKLERHLSASQDERLGLSKLYSYPCKFPSQDKKKEKEKTKMDKRKVWLSHSCSTGNPEIPLARATEAEFVIVCLVSPSWSGQRASLTWVHEWWTGL